MSRVIQKEQETSILESRMISLITLLLMSQHVCHTLFERIPFLTLKNCVVLPSSYWKRTSLSEPKYIFSPFLGPSLHETWNNHFTLDIEIILLQFVFLLILTLLLYFCNCTKYYFHVKNSVQLFFASSQYKNNIKIKAKTKWNYMINFL